MVLGTTKLALPSINLADLHVNSVKFFIFDY